MKKLTIILVLLFSAVIFARAQALVQCDSKTEEQNKVLARKFYERV